MVGTDVINSKSAYSILYVRKFETEPIRLVAKMEILTSIRNK